MSWIAASFAVLGAALVAGFAWYERQHPSSRVLALVAALAALAALGRVAFAPLPNVKPTTDIVLISGYVLGGAPGFAVGAIAALASNLFFGQGPWTPWQMFGWGAVGVGGALLARVAGREAGRIALAAAGAVAGVLFGAVMNLHLWILYSGDHTAAKLWAVFATSLPFDLAHVAGNVAFALAFGPALVAALRRFRGRMQVTWLPAGATAAAALAVVVAAGAAAPAARASTDATANAAKANASLRYLLSAQNPDGGWGGAPKQASTPLHTAWAALGIAAAGRNPRDAGKAIAYVRAHARDGGDLGSVTRTILVLSAAGVPPRDAAGRDLVKTVLAKQRPDGSFAGRVNTTAFALLALRATGRGRASAPVRRAATWIAGQANADGGFNFAGAGGPSGVDDTGAALQALGAAGRRSAPVTRRAASWLARRQNPDGGFPLLDGGASNAQSTAWAVQGLLAAGRDPAKVRRGGSRDPLAYLRSLTDASGETHYSRTGRQTPVWVTAQAVMALARKPLPVAAAPRRRSLSAATPATAAAPATAATTAPTVAAKRRRPQSLPPIPTPASAGARLVRPAVTTAVVAVTVPARARAAGFAAGALAAALR